MKYTILSATQLDDTVVTEVEYVFDDGSKSTVSISHFRPQSADDIMLGITNRYASEQARLTAVATAAALIPLVKTGVEVVS